MFVVHSSLFTLKLKLNIPAVESKLKGRERLEGGQSAPFQQIRAPFLQRQWLSPGRCVHLLLLSPREGKHEKLETFSNRRSYPKRDYKLTLAKRQIRVQSGFGDWQETPVYTRW